jgi:hypothetical protein
MDIRAEELPFVPSLSGSTLKTKPVIPQSEGCFVQKQAASFQWLFLLAL